MTDDVFESRCLRFEEAWARGGPCPIADFLDDPLLSSPADRGRLLVELIAIDLEFRWRNPRREGGSTGRLLPEDYLSLFPEPGPLDRISTELVGEEYPLLTGRPPHPGRRLPDVLADVVSARPVISPEVLRPDLPGPVIDFCRKCLAKSPDERYPSVREARLALAERIGYDDRGIGSMSSQCLR